MIHTGRRSVASPRQVRRKRSFTRGRIAEGDLGHRSTERRKSERLRAVVPPHLPSPPLPPHTRPPGERRETTKARISFLLFPTPSLPGAGCEVGERGKGE